MDELHMLTLASPRSTNAKAVYAHKLSARSKHTAVGSPRAGLSPRPPPTRSSSSGAGAHHTPRRNGETASSSSSTFESFRSVSVLEEIVRVESTHSRSAMGPEEAFQLLQRLIPQTPSDRLDGFTCQQFLNGLESSCWRCFSKSPTKRHHPHSQQNQNQTTSSSNTTTGITTSMRLAVRYMQLYHGIQESIHEKETAIQSLEMKVRETIAHTNELPRHIKIREQEIAKTIASFVALSAMSLDFAVQRNRTKFGQNLLKTTVDSTLLTAKVKERIATLRRRKDLRTWACNELRSVINDHLTHASELKKEITVVLSDVKKEELAHKVKTKRMEDAMVGMVMSPTARKNSMCGVVATKVLVSGGLAAVATAANLANTPAPSIAMHERLTQAHEKRQQLLEEIALRQEQVRRRTEEIFDVRNDIKEQDAHKKDVVQQAEALDTEMAHIQRACTPRPDWEELERAVMVTTAADQVGRTARMSLQSRERRGPRGGGDNKQQLDEDDEEYTARQMKTILTSTWSTVDKVDALAKELARIRTRYHGGDELETEKAKLNQLQQEIQNTVEKLTAIRTLSSRGGGGPPRGAGSSG